MAGDDTTNKDDGHLTFYTAAAGTVAERLRIDSGGRLLIGTAANQHNSGDLLQLAATSSTASLGLNRYTANAHPSYINFFKSRNASLSGQTVVQDGDNLGQITWAGSDGTNRAYAAFIDAEVDGTPGDGDMPGRLTFSTSADGSESPSERMRITSAGFVGISETTPVCKLDVDGAARFGSANTDKHQDGCIIERNSGDGMVHITAGRSGGNYSGFNFYVSGDTGGSGANAKLRHTIDHAGNFTWYDSDGSTSRLKIDSNGRVLIGTTNTGNVTNGGLKIQAEATDGVATCLNIRNPQLSGGNAAVRIEFNMDRTGGGIHFQAGAITVHKKQEWTSTPGTVDSYMTFGTILSESLTEKMRLTSDGDLFVNATSEPGQGDDGARLSGSGSYHIFARNSSSSAVLRSFGANGEFRAVGDGDCENTNNSYGGISDRVLKENEVDASSQWNDIKALKIKNYNLKSKPGEKHLGVIAQDLEASGISGLVKTNPDELYTASDELPSGKNIGDVKEKGYKRVKYSVLYMKAVKALQEAITKIETLETKVAALESS